MNHADRTIEHILQIFDQHGSVRLTPAYVAYELDMTSAEAEKALDGMVKHSLLDLDFDENGQLYYSLSREAVMGSIGQSPRPTPARQSRPNPAAGPASAAAGGFDGHVGHNTSSGNLSGQQSSRQAGSHRANAPKGCDGSLGPTNDWWAQPQPSERVAQAKRPHPQRRPGGHAGGSEPTPAPQTQLARPREHHLVVERTAEPMIAALLSVLLPGSGQLYNREVGKGLAMFISWWALWLVALGWIVNIWSVVDAYGTATRRRRLADELSSET
jgi:TM2 domain-containing membrane protein YozV